MIIASNNKNKIIQIKEILKDYELKGLKESGIDIDVEETGSTFEENSALKANAIYKLSKESVIADDSGLCIEAFNGWPGVETHRCLGNVTNLERNTYILNKMKDLKYDERKCTAVCVITLVDKNGKNYHFRGELNGHISKDIRGLNTFGFDDIFELDDGHTLAELTNEEKYKYGARAKAIRLMEQFLKEHKEVEI